MCPRHKNLSALCAYWIWPGIKPAAWNVFCWSGKLTEGEDGERRIVTFEHWFVQTRPLKNSTIYKWNLSLLTKNLWDTIEEIVIYNYNSCWCHILIIILSDLVDYSLFIFFHTIIILRYKYYLKNHIFWNMFNLYFSMKYMYRMYDYVNKVSQYFQDKAV